MIAIAGKREYLNYLVEEYLTEDPEIKLFDVIHQEVTKLSRENPEDVRRVLDQQIQAEIKVAQ